MAGLTGNQCTIITIIPMEVECNVTNASSPTASDGSAIVQVFGGTPPYSITWNNGQQGNTLTNLTPGIYFATVVDYFGDYVKKTTCVVGSSSETVYKFITCPGFSSRTIYVSGATYEPPFPNFKPTIIFNEIPGCYEFIGPVNSSGLEVSALTINSSYTTCTVCNPPTPTPPTQDPLCLSHSELNQQYNFTPNGTDNNGNFQWLDTVNGLTLTYNVTNGWWEVLVWTSISGNQGVMRLTQSPPQLQPIGTWQNQGVPPTKANWVMVVGTCSSNLTSLSLSVTPISPQCEGQLGSVLMNANGGSSPYSYVIQGITSSQANSQFNNVQPGSYVAQVTDSSGNVATANFTISQGVGAPSYTIQLNKFNQVVTNNLREQVVSYQYDVVVTPQLPSGVQVSFDLDFAHTRTSTYPDNSSSDPVTYENTFTGSLDGNAVSISSTSPVVLGSPPSQNCPNYQIDIATFSSTGDTTITIDGSSTFNGTVSTTVTLPRYLSSGSCNCPITGLNRTNVQLKNVQIIGTTTCGTINNISTPITGESTQSGCLPLT